MKIPLTKQYLEQAHLVDKMRISAIARVTGWQAATVRKELSRCGITQQNYKTPCKDLTGLVFVNLTVKGIDHKTPESIFWRCICKCGTEVVAHGGNLKNGNAKSCGCLRRTKVGDLSGEQFNTIRKNALKRGIPLSLTPKELWDLLVKQNHLCALSGLPISAIRTKNVARTASLDRIDSNKPYTLDNIQWVHKDINFMKVNFPESKFVEYCKLIIQKHYSKETTDYSI